MFGSVLMGLALAAAPAPVAPRATPEAAPTPDARRYCVVDTITGSRMPRRVCHDRTEWMKRGFDPLAK